MVLSGEKKVSSLLYCGDMADAPERRGRHGALSAGVATALPMMTARLAADIIKGHHVQLRKRMRNGGYAIGRIGHPCDEEDPPVVPTSGGGRPPPAVGDDRGRRGEEDVATETQRREGDRRELSAVGPSDTTEVAADEDEAARRRYASAMHFLATQGWAGGDNEGAVEGDEEEGTPSSRRYDDRIGLVVQCIRDYFEGGSTVSGAGGEGCVRPLLYRDVWKAFRRQRFDALRPVIIGDALQPQQPPASPPLPLTRVSSPHEFVRVLQQHVVADADARDAAWDDSGCAASVAAASSPCCRIVDVGSCYNPFRHCFDGTPTQGGTSSATRAERIEPSPSSLGVLSAPRLPPADAEGEEDPEAVQFDRQPLSVTVEAMDLSHPPQDDDEEGGFDVAIGDWLTVPVVVDRSPSSAASPRGPSPLFGRRLTNGEDDDESPVFVLSRPPPVDTMRQKKDGAPKAKSPRIPKQLAGVRASSAHVVIFSLVLSYMPCPRMRYAAIVKAHRVLRPLGLLIVVSTRTQGKRSGDWVPTWVAQISGIGFALMQKTVRHQLVLLAFRKQLGEEERAGNVAAAVTVVQQPPPAAAVSTLVQCWLSSPECGPRAGGELRILADDRAVETAV